MSALILTILCSTSIALLLKHNDTRRGNAVVLLAGNYLIASLISFIFLLIDDRDVYSRQTFVFGLLLGVLFVIAFFAFARAVGIAGTALATVSSRLSVVVPLVLSVFIYAEYPSVYQVFGFVFTVATIILFYKSLKSGQVEQLRLKSYLYLIVVLVGIGINDFCMKVFQEWRPVAEKSFFLFCIFTSAFLVSTTYIFLKGIKIDYRVAARGIVLGIPNMFSSFFLLAALEELEGIIVYPSTNIGIIVLTSLLALLIWKEKLNRYGIAAMFAGVAAIVLLGF
jgi:drug/metabolite transporter (DMT)-like permease